jgi:type IV pilus assembly protein PilW
MNGFRYKSQLGLTLIELMIALVLSLFLLAGIIKVFTTNNQSYRVTEAHSRLQENVRFSLNTLSKDIRSAGYTGCRTIENMGVRTIAQIPIPAIMDETTIVNGLNAETALTWNTAPDANFGAVVGGTDLITVQGASSCGGALVSNVTSPTDAVQISLPNSCSITADDVLVLADCEHAHIFRATAVANDTVNGIQTVSHAAGATDNLTSRFCKSYGSPVTDVACATGEDKIYSYDSELLTFRAFTYFIRNGTNGDPALWRYNHSLSASASNPVELIEGIENMQIIYGVDDNDDDIVDRYENAKTVEDGTLWDKVVSARVSLLAQTLENNLTTADRALTFDGVNISGADGKIRRGFTTTIGIRNRVQ